LTSSAYRDTQLEMIDMQGKIVHSTPIDVFEGLFAINVFDQGSYFMFLLNEEGIKERWKIMIQ